MKIRHNKKTANTKRQFRPAKELSSNKSTKQEKFIFFLFLLGLVLLIWEVSIYRRTIIAFNIPLIIFIIPGVFLTLVFYEKLNKIQDINIHFLIHYFFHSFTSGSFILFLFMSSNFYFAGNQTTEKTFEIIHKGSMAAGKGRQFIERIPYVVIHYEGIEKQLIFSYSETDKIHSSSKVHLTIRQGLWGFDILEKYEAI